MKLTTIVATVVALIMMLGGCATTSGLSAKSEISRFDGSRLVSIPTHGANCGRSFDPCALLGAQWNSDKPDDAFLIVGIIGEYIGIQGATVRIDGKNHPLEKTFETTEFQDNNPVGTGLLLPPESDQSFHVQLALIRQIAASHDVRIRVLTTHGYIDSVIADGKTDSKAYYAMRRFLAEVDRKPQTTAAAAK